MKSHVPTPANDPIYPQPDTASVAARIRALRLERGWTLSDVEKRSGGSLKAVVLGSYERCDRSLSLERTIEIARLLSVPLHHLLSEPAVLPPISTRPLLMIDLRRARYLAQDSGERDEHVLRNVSAFIAWIATKRSDWNGEIMSLRDSDLATLAIMALMSEEQILLWLHERNLIVTELDRP